MTKDAINAPWTRTERKLFCACVGAFYLSFLKKGNKRKKMKNQSKKYSETKSKKKKRNKNDLDCKGCE